MYSARTGKARIGHPHMRFNLLPLLASHETVRFWWNRFGPMFAAEIRKKRVAHMRAYPQWRWHLDEGVPRRGLPFATPPT